MRFNNRLRLPTGLTIGVASTQTVAPVELHVEDALAVLDPGSRPEPIAPVARSSPVGSRSLLVTTGYFAAERIALGSGEELELTAEGSPQVLTCLAGARHRRHPGR